VNNKLCAAVLSDHSREIFSICLETSLIRLINFLNSLSFLSLDTPIRKRKSSFTMVCTVKNWPNLSASGCGLVAGPCECGNALSGVLTFWTFLTIWVRKSSSRENLMHAVSFQFLHLYISFQCKRNLLMGKNLSKHDKTLCLYCYPIVLQSPGQ